jgi:hypothetical protein
MHDGNDESTLNSINRWLCALHFLHPQSSPSKVQFSSAMKGKITATASMFLLLLLLLLLTFG